MESIDSDRIRQLKLIAKWSSDNHEKKQAILQLQRCGDEALPAIEEVLAITAYADVKQTCIDAISSLGKEQRNDQASDIKRVLHNTRSRKASKRKQQKKKAKQTKK